jgi:alpha-tubulin suppressor-like RCC1 family protein
MFICILICSWLFSVVVDSQGQVYTAGWGTKGQLGRALKRGRIFDSEFQVVTSALSAEKVSRLAVGRSHSMVMTNNGELFSWGANSEGQLGVGLVNLFLALYILAWYHLFEAENLSYEFQGFQR